MSIVPVLGPGKNYDSVHVTGYSVAPMAEGIPRSEVIDSRRQRVTG